MHQWWVSEAARVTHTIFMSEALILFQTRISILLLLLNSYNLWWDFRKPFHNLAAWEFLPETIRLSNPWPCIIIVAKDSAGWLCEPCVCKKFITFLIYRWHSFLWERLVIPLEMKSFSSAVSSTAATVWLLVKHFSGRVTAEWPVLSFLRDRSISLLSRWQKQANSKFLNQPGSSGHRSSLVQNALFLLGIYRQPHFQSKLRLSLQPSVLLTQEPAAVPGRRTATRPGSGARIAAAISRAFADGWFSCCVGAGR